MITLLSPAKTLDVESPVSFTTSSIPVFEEEPKRIMRKLKTLSRKKIGELMSLSSTLAELNHERFQLWSDGEDKNQLKQAGFMFKGDVYVGLDIESLSEEEVKHAQNQIRILSGLYGVLKPMDLIQPYRLEMGTKLPLARKKNLYEFWGSKIADYLNSELQDHSSQVVVNLASNEYFKAANAKKIEFPIFTPVFKEAKNGEFKVLSFFAKKARGTMARWMVQNNIDEVERLREFNEDGYSFNDLLSTENELVFTRG